jgi:hypothetical protein
MNIDFHYGVVYVVARLGGMPADDACVVAHACQYIDDATTAGLLLFKGGETYERFASAHSMHDYQNAENADNRLVWAPFHFLPANQGVTLEERAVCRPDSDIAREVVRRAIRGADAVNALHRLGVTLHSYVDTWAHQGFSGIKSDVNRVHDLEAEDCTATQWGERLKQFASHLLSEVETNVLSRIFPLGHGAALHYPDQPWAEWSYVDMNGTRVYRKNLPDFLVAADMACRAVRGFLSKKENFEDLPGLSPEAIRALELLLSTNRDNDPDNRLRMLTDSVGAGIIPGLHEQVPAYIAKGPGSWKHAATGIASVDDGKIEPEHTAAFEASDYRYFHDAVKEH